jgi:hypothetical protein
MDVRRTSSDGPLSYLFVFLFSSAAALFSFARSIGAPLFDELAAVLVPIVKAEVAVARVEPSAVAERVDKLLGVSLPHHADRYVFGVVLRRSPSEA